MIQVIMYTRSGCHLCDLAREDLASINQQYPHDLLEIDIESKKDLELAYGFDVPFPGTIGVIFFHSVQTV